MERPEAFSRFYPFGYYKHKGYFRPHHFHPENGQVFVYKMYRGGSPWIKLTIAAIIGIYIGQNYQFPKIEGPFKMYARFKEYCQQNRIKSSEVNNTNQVQETAKTSTSGSTPEK